MNTSTGDLSASEQLRYIDFKRTSYRQSFVVENVAFAIFNSA